MEKQAAGAPLLESRFLLFGPGGEQQRKMASHMETLVQLKRQEISKLETYINRIEKMNQRHEATSGIVSAFERPANLRGAL
jgi:hypothetical protein